MKKMCLILFICVFSGFGVFGEDLEPEEIDFLLFQPNFSNLFVNEEQASTQLNNLAKNLMLKNLGAGQIHVYGYAAFAQNGPNPEQLSRDRAVFIINELQKRGVQNELFSDPIGYGSVNIWGANSNEETRKPNRRVRILLDVNQSVTQDESGIDGVIIIDNSDQNYSEIVTKEKKSNGKFPWWIILIALLVIAAIIGLIFFIKTIGNGSSGSVIESTRSKGSISFEKTITNVSPSVSNVSSSRLPATGGTWTGERGNSEFNLDLDKKPNRFNYDPPRTWKEIIIGNKNFVKDDPILPESTKARLNDHYNRILNGNEGILFQNGEIQLPGISLVTVEIDSFSTERYGSEGNMQKADIEAAKQLNMTVDEFKNWRNKNELMWHERKDRKTMDLISHDIHDNVDHSGGISEAKRTG